jgi:non-ribosomal peptide synthetase component E (peptide arylation enzyme)
MAGKLTFNLADMFEAVADAVGERTAIVSCQRRLSYSELDERATRLANCWAGLGIGRGDQYSTNLCTASYWRYHLAYCRSAKPCILTTGISLCGVRTTPSKRPNS